MSQTVRETITTNDDIVTPATNITSDQPYVGMFRLVEYIIYFFFGSVELLLIARLMLMMTGASLASSFVGIIYGISQVFVSPFVGIFRDGVAQMSGSTNLVFEPSTLVALVVYLVIGFAFAEVLRAVSGKRRVLS